MQGQVFAHELVVFPVAAFVVVTCWDNEQERVLGRSHRCMLRMSAIHDGDANQCCKDPESSLVVAFLALVQRDVWPLIGIAFSQSVPVFVWKTDHFQKIALREGRLGGMEERRPLLKSQASAKYTKEKLHLVNCFDLIHRIKRDVTALCDTPLNIKELESPRLSFLIIPLQEKYIKLDCVALVYCLLVCRVHFLDQQSSPSAYSLAHSRAAICEILAVKVVRARYDEDPGSNETVRLK